LASQLNNPEILRQSLQMARNPALMQGLFGATIVMIHVLIRLNALAPGRFIRLKIAKFQLTSLNFVWCFVVLNHDQLNIFKNSEMMRQQDRQLSNIEAQSVDN
jgi:hypothetical protein